MTDNIVHISIHFHNNSHVSKFRYIMVALLRIWVCILISAFVEKITANDESFERFRDELEERVAKLEDLAKVGTLRSCSEYSRFGLKKSGPYMIDPDGSLLGEEPFQVIK